MANTLYLTCQPFQAGAEVALQRGTPQQFNLKRLPHLMKWGTAIQKNLYLYTDFCPFHDNITFLYLTIRTFTATATRQDSPVKQINSTLKQQTKLKTPAHPLFKSKCIWYTVNKKQNPTNRLLEHHPPTSKSTRMNSFCPSSLPAHLAKH